MHAKQNYSRKSRMGGRVQAEVGKARVGQHGSTKQAYWLRLPPHLNGAYFEVLGGHGERNDLRGECARIRRHSVGGV